MAMIMLYCPILRNRRKKYYLKVNRDDGSCHNVLDIDTL